MKFGEVAGFLSDLYGVLSKDRTAFDGRLKNFIRIGWPKSDTIKLGRGKTADFTPAAIAHLFFVTELTVIGFQPERAINIVLSNLADLEAAIEGDGLCTLRLSPALGSCAPLASINLDVSPIRPLLAAA